MNRTFGMHGNISSAEELIIAMKGDYEESENPETTRWAIFMSEDYSYIAIGYTRNDTAGQDSYWTFGLNY